MLQNKEQRGRMVVGGTVILLGLIVLLSNIVEDNALIAWLWILGLGGAAAIFGWAYRTDGEPLAALSAYIAGANALLIFLITMASFEGVMVPVIVLLLIGAPFVFAWWRNQKRWGLLIPAFVMVTVALGLLLIEAVGFSKELLPAYMMFAVGLPFVLAYTVSNNMSLLIPGSIMFLVGMVFLVSATAQAAQLLGIVIPVLVISAGVVWLFRREAGVTLTHG